MTIYGGFGSSAFGGGDGWLAGAPTIDSFSPADLADLERMEAITFKVRDLSPGVASVWIRMLYDGDTDWLSVYDGPIDDAVFLGTFERESSKTAISGGYLFSVLPAGGWRKPLRLRVRAIDVAGTIDVEV